MSGNWWDILPRKVFSTLEEIETDQPWYSVYRIHDWLYALLEDGQYDEALMYLVIGEKRAVVIDGGTGIGSLKRLVEELTDRPCFLLLTHTHNDHIGGCKEFEEIAVFDDVMSWESAAKGLGKDKMGEMIEPGAVIKSLPEDFDSGNFYAPPFRVTHWLEEGDILELGGRSLEVIHTPGHSPDSICLLDRENKIFWTGDSFYPALIYIYSPTTSLDQFIESFSKMVELMPYYEWVMPSHNEPKIEKHLIKECYTAAKNIKEGTAGAYTEGIAAGIKVHRYDYDRFSLIVRAER
jgi:glyoxylase-like metal-dependent hydrolase (beta-lactamase superfamily II)